MPTKNKLLLFLSAFWLMLPQVLLASDDKEIVTYIRNIYVFGVGSIGIVAAMVLMLGGLIWITSMGNAQRIGEAKAWIAAAFTGLLIALFSWLILNTINPALVKPGVDKGKAERATESANDGSVGSREWNQINDGLISPHQAQQIKEKQQKESCQRRGGSVISAITTNGAKKGCDTYCTSMGTEFIGVSTIISSGPTSGANVCCECRVAH